MYTELPEDLKPQIQFACFTSETEILVHHALTGGNWEEVVSTVMTEVKENQKLTINYQDAYHIHYINRPPHTFFAISDSLFSRSLAFTFLREIEEYCAAEYAGTDSSQEAKMFLATKMNYYNANQDLDKVAQVRQQIEEVNEIMFLNIEKALSRGEKVEILTDKTKVIKGKAQMFRLQSKTVKHFMTIRNNIKKVLVILAIILIVLIIAIALYCEDQSWHNCISNIFCELYKAKTSNSMMQNGDDFAQRLVFGWINSSREDTLRDLTQELMAEKTKSEVLAKALQEEKARISDLEAIIIGFTRDKATHQVRKTSSGSAVEGLTDCADSSEEEEVYKGTGQYPPHIRKMKILRYKSKLLRRRLQVPVSRVFKGRSKAALRKDRSSGKFVKYC